ncbi:hypothetical protein NAC44_20900 [Allorhizobium sp. BGMRC 0089]|uniref:hypothetical protein n=1 Tax=Allorhizobium sonneratiae TaxID=2934936 RepID=UPI00203497A1|nr:hypothetical protein [Allorhizobium sonneratiae]MCM2294789.1 hypothetical protein [Allorhizobium sonneratiae]
MRTIGKMEKETGICPSQQNRFDFWLRFRNDDGLLGLNDRAKELTPWIQKKILYNCCHRANEPDWTQFSHLEIGGCVNLAEEGSDETCVEGGYDRDDAQFFAIYGRYKTGHCEAITDCPTFEDACAVYLILQKKSGLPLTVMC